MQLPALQGLIRRRLLLNFAADPEVVSRILPAPLKPKVAAGHAVVGVCLIRLEQIRPRHVPAALGITSENAAHRIAVTWHDNDGSEREGVYIPRRDTGSLLNYLAGGRLFPGEHHRAQFSVNDDGTSVDLAMRSHDGVTSVEVRATRSETFDSSLFPSLDAASRFFEAGSFGCSARKDGRSLDAITLHTNAWAVAPMRVQEVHSSFFEDRTLFPDGVAFDCALVMRDVPHQWRSEPDLPLLGAAARETKH